MTNEARAVAHIAGRFRPESISHFKEVAKSLAWLLERPAQKCQEDLARIYGYSGLHELQQVLKTAGIPGPFAPRYNYLAPSNETLVEGQEQRIFFILFGAPKGHWRENHLAEDKCFLVFEMGLFQEAAEHRACFSKIKEFLQYGGRSEGWPLIHGWPLGLKSWLASGYTEPFDMAEGWQKKMPQSYYGPIEYADIRWQRRTTGLTRLETMFQVLALRVTGRKPRGMGKVAFDHLEDEGGGFYEPEWEGECFVEWLTDKLPSDVGVMTRSHQEAFQTFAQRPSRATAAACEFVKDLRDPTGFRDRWAFESFKAALASYRRQGKGQFESNLEDGTLLSLCLRMDSSTLGIGKYYGCQLWQLHSTLAEVTEQVGVGGKPKLQPIIHANGALIVPFDDELRAMSSWEWYISHDDSDFASELAAAAFEKLYLPALGLHEFNFPQRQWFYSIIEIDELLVAPGVSSDTLKTYFRRLLGSFDGQCLPDSYGYWAHTLCLDFNDEDENERRTEDGDYADYVYQPLVLLINVPGCGRSFVKADPPDAEHVSVLMADTKKRPTASGIALAALLRDAVQDLDVDVVIYDGENLRD